MNLPPWEQDNEALSDARANLFACAYNAAVNHGPDRGLRKMSDLIRAINHYERLEGAAKLDYLVSQGVIDSYKPCPAECVVRPGGLFHAKDCENDSNHPVDRTRRIRAVEKLPGPIVARLYTSLVGNAEYQPY